MASTGGFAVSCGSCPEVNGFYKALGSGMFHHTMNYHLTLSRQPGGEWEFKLDSKAVCRSSGSSEDPCTLRQWTYLKKSFFSETPRACNDLGIIRAAMTDTGSIYVAAFARDISASALVFSENDTIVRRPGAASCYPVAFAHLPGHRCCFSVRLNYFPQNGNWMTFGLAWRDMPATYSDGFGRSYNTWGIAQDSSAALPIVVASRVTVAAPRRRLRAGDVLTGEVDTLAGWFEIRLNDSEFVHRFSLPQRGLTEAHYRFGMTLATDHQASVHIPVPAGPVPSAVPCRAWDTELSNPSLPFSDTARTVLRPGGASVLPTAFATLAAERACLTVRLDAAQLSANRLVFGLTKRGSKNAGLDSFGSAVGMWGITDNRAVSNIDRASARAFNAHVTDLPRKLKEGDVLYGEADVAAGWFEVRLNQTEFTHRFTIPKSPKEGYWFGMTLANDHQATIYPDVSSAMEGSAAHTMDQSRDPEERRGPVRVTKWDTGISEPALTFRMHDTVVQREGSVSVYPAAFARLPSEHVLLRVKLDSAPLHGNLLTFGLTKRGMKSVSSDGLGRTPDSWGVLDDRGHSNSTSMPILAAGSKSSVAAKWPRKLRQGDVLTVEADLTAGWCEVRLNDNEALHRFTVPQGKRADYWFGVTLATDHQVSICPEDTAGPAPMSPAASTASGSPVLDQASQTSTSTQPSPSMTPALVDEASRLTPSTEWKLDISDPKLKFSNDNTTARRPGTLSSYPAAFALLPSPHASLAVRLDSASLSGSWLTFGLAVRGMKRDSTDGLGRSQNSWGIADDRAAAAALQLPIVAANGMVVATLPRKLKEGDVLYGEVDAAVGWFEVRLNQTEFTHRFAIPKRPKEGYWFGMTFASSHQGTILRDYTIAAEAPAGLPLPPLPAAEAPTPDIPPEPAAASEPLVEGTQDGNGRDRSATAPDASSSSGKESGSSAQVETVPASTAPKASPEPATGPSPGSSAVQAIYADLPADCASLTVKLHTTAQSERAGAGLLCFGLLKRGASVDRGIGMSPDTWGITQDAFWALPAACGTWGDFHLGRMLRDGDVLYGEVDVAAGRFELGVNRTELVEHFVIPKGPCGDYVFGITLPAGWAMSLAWGNKDAFAVPEARRSEKGAQSGAQGGVKPLNAIERVSVSDNANDPVLPSISLEQPGQFDGDGDGTEEWANDPVQVPYDSWLAAQEGTPANPSPSSSRVQAPLPNVELVTKAPQPSLGPSPSDLAARYRFKRELMRQELAQAPARRDWIVRRNELQRRLTAATEAEPVDYMLIAALGTALKDHEKLSSTLLLTEEAFSTLLMRYKALETEIDGLCKSLAATGDFETLQVMAVQLTELRAMDLSSLELPTL